MYAPQTTHRKLVSGIRQYFRKNGFIKAVLGVSGGVDSALCARLSVDALGAENVFGVIMPEKGITAKTDVIDAVSLCKIMRIPYSVIEISHIVRDYKKVPWKRNKISLMNIKPRIRANILYDYANSHKALVIGTSNKSEILLGYGTKHGDLASDILPIGALYKTDVLRLAEFLKLPKAITEKTPSAGLYKGQTDASELGAEYSVLDRILQGKSTEDKNLISSVKARMRQSRHKSMSTPVVRV